MTFRSSFRLALLLVAVCVAVPATAIVARVTVYFAASFNAIGAPGPSGISAEIGYMEETGPAGVFTVVPGPSSGVLRIADSGLTADASLRANLKQLFKGNDVTIHFQLSASQTNATLTMRAEDDADSGLIDLDFDGGGTIRVDGADTGKSYEKGSTYVGDLMLRDALIGPSTWTLVLQSDKGEILSMQGLMKSNAPLRMEDVQFIRAAGGAPGEFFVDDLRVTSNSLLPSN